eukprot:scaffold99931_cov13-Tisochrysis_lutea.AAC.1
MKGSHISSPGATWPATPCKREKKESKQASAKQDPYINPMGSKKSNAGESNDRLPYLPGSGVTWPVAPCEARLQP